jgi:diaminopimelate epimerase
MNFTKLQGAGNDFVLVEADQKQLDWPRLAIAICQRHFGIGADGLLLLLPSDKADLRMRVFNPDGSEAEACGNGLRCLVRYALEKELVSTNAAEITIETIAGVRQARLHNKGIETIIQVGMGEPKFSAKEIPVNLDSKVAEPIMDYPLSQIGPEVENHPIFPQRTNLEVARVLSPKLIEARVWERGVGETLACGSGACAIAVLARLKGHTDSQVDIKLPGGTLSVAWEGKGEVALSGPAEIVFIGEWPDETIATH